jgi:MFS family permease
LDILAGPYGRTVGLLFFFHLAQYLAIPIIPLFLVNQLSLTDPEIGLGNATFYALVFLGSTQLGRFSSKWGHKAVTGYGILLLAFYPGFIALSQGISLYLVASIVGGFAWSMTGGALYNYLLEKVPATDRPPYLAWYNLGLHAAVLIGSLAGPLFASQVGLVTALLCFMALRMIAGLAIIRLG